MERYFATLPVVASAPFNKPSADIILRSSNDVEFHVHKIILMLASPVFEDMFTIPQARDTPSDSLPVVQVSEDSRILDAVLRICYPCANPELRSLAEITAVLEAGMKYDMEDVVARMRRALGALIPNDPLSVYVTAVRFDFEDEARAAAMATARQPRFDYVPYLDRMSAGALHRLLRDRQEASPLSRLFRSMAEQKGGRARPAGTDSPVSGVPKGPITSHPFDNPSTDVILQASDGVQFHVHRYVLSAASDVFERELWPDSGVEASQREPPSLLLVPEDSWTLFDFLHFFYPLGNPEVQDMHVAHGLLAISMRYNVPDAVVLARREWTKMMKSDPLRAYFIAMRHVLEEEVRAQGCSGTSGAHVPEREARAVESRHELRQLAKVASDHAVAFEQTWKYCTEMECVPADVYHRLLDYRATHRGLRGASLRLALAQTV